MMAQIDDTPGVTAVAAVPWQLKDIEAWRRARQPVDLLGTAEQAPPPTISDPVVEVALRHLTQSVNLSTGLVHPSDKDHAIETFRLLRKAGYTWDPNQILAWALANGWHHDGADDLHRYAAGTLEGRRFRTGGHYGLNAGAVRLWEAESSGVPDD